MNRNNNRFLYIIGAGGFGREVAWLVERFNAVSAEEQWELRGFIDDNVELWNTAIDCYKVHGGYDVLENSSEDVWCIVAIGNPKVRKKIIERLRSFSHIHFARLVDPSVKMSETSTIGEGSIICAGTIITVDVKIGSHCIINLDCTVGHDAWIADFVTLYPSVNVSGCVKVGESTELGTGSQIIQGVSVGRGTVIGAGSTVIRNIEDEVTAVGSPAQNIKRH
ncbi:acetyltransferase [Acetatifactor muris]|jgi:sugar O-acyltransferase (sialic acid O-acetyltransferase NeuD family)|uniref:Acetyltransferase EpsM n=1 Tax=Acetatifactor muris TaxID=879566 RepID=A0A2K4ZAB3_9FIRM|nr:acetyltransferase [Acetatifactor muris]MCR2047484.1 acetyltransferase [Acetatifactor muris]SOY27379.1 Putative acetyltransferase EpsM [Acetatifactor muris]